MPEEWKTVRVTDTERMEIADRLLKVATVYDLAGNTADANYSRYLAGLLVFCDARAEVP